MNAAAAPRSATAVRLLHVDPRTLALADRALGELAELLRPGDLLVVNDAATLPASLHGATARGEPIEARLLSGTGDGRWRAALLGAGDWRTRTEDRPAPPLPRPGDVLRLGGIAARVAAVDEVSPRLLELEFEAGGDALWRALYRSGRPVQYAHVAGPLALWDVQTGYASRPWAAEPPSAGLALTWELLLDLRRRGIGLARVTEAAGLTATGDDGLDRRFPLAEEYEVPQDTVAAIARARERGGRVVAVGTSVTRALEGAAANGGGRLRAGRGTTGLVIGPTTRRAVVEGILTGVHDPDTTHFRLLESFAPRPLLERALAFAGERGYLGHEFGDAMLILGG